MAAAQCIWACRHSQDDLLKFKPNIRMGKKGNISVCKRGMAVVTRRAGPSFSETAHLPGFSHTAILRVYDRSVLIF